MENERSYLSWFTAYILQFAFVAERTYTNGQQVYGAQRFNGNA